jgi:hypothetical protein
MKATRAVIPVLIVLLAAAPAMGRQSANQSELWRTFAERLEPGALVTVRLKDGSRFKAHLIKVSAEALDVKPKTRIPVPVRAVPLDTIESIQPEKQGMSPGAKVALGVGLGLASALVLTFLAFLSEAS